MKMTYKKVCVLLFIVWGAFFGSLIADVAIHLLRR